MTTRILLILLCLSCLLSACKDKEDLDSGLFGTWNVTRVAGQQYNNGSAGLSLADSSPSGYVRFDDDGTGEQNYYFTLFGTNYPNINEFRWEADASEIRIDRFNQPDLVWRRVTNEPDKQVATYNIVISATENWDYTLTLER